jgi:hypothetical protein
MSTTNGFAALVGSLCLGVAFGGCSEQSPRLANEGRRSGSLAKAEATQSCRDITAHGSQPDFIAPCGDYTYCISGPVEGDHLTGTYLFQTMAGWKHPYADPDSPTLNQEWGDSVIDTTQGKIFGRERDIVEYDPIAFNWVGHVMITGGTGRYEGATGFILNYGGNEYFGISGKICLP